jgi:acyl dehydratase
VRATRIDRSIVGAPLGTSTVEVTAEQTRAYARATNDANPAYFDGSGGIAPPMFQVVLAALAMPRESMVATGLDVIGERIGLHAEQAMEFIAPIVPGETIVTNAQVAAVEEHRLGDMARIRIESRTVAGDERCYAEHSILFVDDQSRLNAPRTKRPAPDAPEPATASSQVVVRTGQSLEYAEASGDYTRTHVDEEFARTWGYPTFLLHGLCTMAFACKGVIDELAGADPTRLRRLAVRFSGPVFPGNTLTTQMWRSPDPSVFTLETTNEAGARVISNGVAEL